MPSDVLMTIMKDVRESCEALKTRSSIKYVHILKGV